jgi:DNA-binding GntR family transcriptional regulator
MPKIHESPPKYEQIADYFRTRIISGDLKPGDEVSSQRALMVEWDVARPTAAKALTALSNEGYVETRRGSGTYVTGYKLGSAGGRPTQAGSVDIAFAADSSIEFLFAETMTGPEHVLQELGQPAESSVVRRRILVKNKDATPAEILTSWFPAELLEKAPLLLEAELAPNAVNAYLSTAIGRRITRSRDKVSARFATEAEQQQLGLDNPSAVLEHRLTIFDTKGQVLLLNEAVYPPHTWRLEQDHRIPSS